VKYHFVLVVAFWLFRRLTETNEFYLFYRLFPAWAISSVSDNSTLFCVARHNDDTKERIISAAAAASGVSISSGGDGNRALTFFCVEN
jgi:hypothetical protein